MKKLLELVEELNFEYYERTQDPENSFSVAGNEFYQELFFSDIRLYNSEDESLIDEDGNDMPIKEFLPIAWERNLERVNSLKPFK